MNDYHWTRIYVVVILGATFVLQVIEVATRH